MRTTQIYTSSKVILLSSLALLILFSLGSCARKISFLNSAVVPAAQGTVKVKKDKNSNYKIQIHLVNLAGVSRIQPARQSYVVWMVTANDETKNIGQINSSSSLLSKKLKASFETVSAVKPVKIFITAEDDAGIQYPGTQVILSTDSF